MKMYNIPNYIQANQDQYNAMLQVLFSYRLSVLLSIYFSYMQILDYG